MKLDSLIDFIESQVPYTYFKNRIPKESVDDCASVKLTGGFPTRDTGIKQPSFQILVRGANTPEGWSESENIANQLYESLTNLEEVMIGEYSVVAIRCMNSVPLFLGTDENDRPIYSLNFSMIVR
ncbi:minor capsid protein [Bacillus sp. JJ1533]|uniref:minor capsid protein n=1 Tax=Bacillus sp. JJ1533 TaxID=3122959 RepID=UPI002FFECE60